MKKRRWLLLGLCFLIVFFCFTGKEADDATPYLAPEPDWHKVLYQRGYQTDAALALIKIEGVITDAPDYARENVCDYDTTIDKLEAAFSDPEIKGIMVFINSPGGGVYESCEIYRTIGELKQEYGKPVVAYMGPMAASGGYYAALPADIIYANPNSLTGSIGVIMAGINIKSLTDKVGIDYVVFKSGANKDMFNSMVEMTPESKAIMQSIVDESYADFLAAFMLHRGLDKETALQLADGRIYTAKQAKQAGIIDEVAGISAAFDELTKLAELLDPMIYEYRDSEKNWWKALLNVSFPGNVLLNWFGSSPLSEADFAHWPYQQPRLMYMSAPVF